MTKKTKTRAVLAALATSALLAVGATGCSDGAAPKAAAAEAESESTEAESESNGGSLLLLKSAWLSLDADDRDVLCGSFDVLDDSEFYALWLVYASSDYVSDLSKADVIGFFAERC